MEKITVGGDTGGFKLNAQADPTDRRNYETFFYQTIINSVRVTVGSPTCTVNQSSKSQNVDLPSISSGNKAGVVGGNKTFNLDFTCGGGSATGVRGMYVTFTDQSNPANVSNTLTPATDSTAKGVGVQIENNSGAISYGPDSSAAANTNAWFAGNASNGNFTIPLKAHLVQTASSSKAGSVVARATFTMSYR